MKTIYKLSFAAAASVFLSIPAGVSLAYANPTQPSNADKIDAYEQSVELRGDGGLRSLREVPTQQKLDVGTILLDPEFGIPGQAESIQKKYEDVKVSTSEGDSSVSDSRVLSNSAGQAKAKNKTAWIEQKWTIAGVTYVKVRTTIGFAAKGKSVTKLNSCESQYQDYVPLRQTDRYQTKSLNKDKTATCITNMTLHRPAQKSVSGKQGLKVNGERKILKRWKF